jgi:hypothetical protein
VIAVITATDIGVFEIDLRFRHQKSISRISVPYKHYCRSLSAKLGEVMQDRQKLEKQVVDIDVASEEMLINQMRWVLERIENLNQGIMGRAVSLAGFAIVELSLVGQLIVTLRKSPLTKNWSINSQKVVFFFAAIVVLCLLLCIGFLMSCVRPMKPGYIPGIEDIQVRLEEGELAKTPAARMFIRKSLTSEQLLYGNSNGKTYGKELSQENLERGAQFRLGFAMLMISQVALGAFVLFAYWR